MKQEMPYHGPANEIQLNGAQHHTQMLMRGEVEDLVFWSIHDHVLMSSSRSGGQLAIDAGYEVRTAVLVGGGDNEHIVVLPLRLDLLGRSPMGLTWGYEGAGPSQLALAILAFVTDDDYALQWYEKFRHEIIATYDPDGPFQLDGISLREWLDRQ